MFITIGIILILFALGLSAVKLFGNLREEPQTISSHGVEELIPASPKFLLNWNWRKGMLLILVGVFFMIANYSYFWSRPGHQYYLIDPFGGKSCIYESGYKIIWPGTRIQEWEKFIDIKTVAQGEPTEGIEGVITDFNAYKLVDDNNKPTGETVNIFGIPSRFNDQVRGNVKVSVRIQLPSDDASFMALVEEFRHPKNLVNNTLIPTVKEQTINTAYMFSAEDYVSGEAANFRQTLDDQLKNGGYAVDKHEYLDTIWSEIQMEEESRTIKEVKTRIEVKQRFDKNGHPIRVEHDITKNNLIVSQVIVDKVTLEPKFQQKLETQRDISAEKSIEMQLTETAKIRQQRIVAEGEATKAEERVQQEKQQVKELIEIETKLKKEETNKKLAAIQLETEKLNAKKIKVAADAKRYELLNADGLSEERKYELDIELEKTKAVAEAIKDAKWPTTYIESGGGGNNEQSFLEALIGAEVAKSMLPKK